MSPKTLYLSLLIPFTLLVNPLTYAQSTPSSPSPATEEESPLPRKPSQTLVRPTVKLSPQERTIEQKRPIPTIPNEAIHQFLNRPRVITPADMETTGYIVDNADRSVLSTAGTKIYALNLEAPGKHKDYTILGLGKAFYNPGEEEVLAYEATYLGDAILDKIGEAGEPDTLIITNAVHEIEKGARLIPTTEQPVVEDFYPHSPAKLEDACIVGVVDDPKEIGQYQIVVINKGKDEKLERGHILVVHKSDPPIEDAVDKNQDNIHLPIRQAGTLLIFKVFDNISYALVLKSTLPINLFDKVAVP